MTYDETRQRRLLDLLAGWEQYVCRCAEGDIFTGRVAKPEYETEFRSIGELYQRVGLIENFTNDDYLTAMQEIGNILRTGGVSETAANKCTCPTESPSWEAACEYCKGYPVTDNYGSDGSGGW